MSCLILINVYSVLPAVLTTTPSMLHGRYKPSLRSLFPPKCVLYTCFCIHLAICIQTSRHPSPCHFGVINSTCDFIYLCSKNYIHSSSYILHCLIFLPLRHEFHKQHNFLFQITSSGKYCQISFYDKFVIYFKNHLTLPPPNCSY